ncbi:MAG: VWA domain-containing protein [Roseovarius sp.]|nr:VWA domain-containing protein [Roseovarius sp.]
MSRFAAVLATALTLAAPAAFADEDVMVVFDGSNSMWGQIDGVAKIEIARDVMENLLGEWTTTRRVGLMAYGHRRRGDCTDIETLIAPATGTAADILAQINRITPTGKTPLTDAVEMAAKQLSYTDRPATVVLISDGLESCERDPCALARALKQGGVGFTAHVVGFGLGNAEDTASLACIAEETGGTYIQANNASELGAALSTLGETVAEAPEPVAEPEPEPEPQAPQITLTAPATALAGSDFDVAWDRTTDPQDYVTIVPAGAEEGTYTNYVRVKDDSKAALRALGDAGLYEVRYVQQATRLTLGSVAIELLEPEVTVSGPQTALTGSKVKIAWTGAVNDRDFVTIVPMGADDGTYGAYIRVDDKSGGELQMPADPGMYELRYLLDEGRRTMASQPIEVTEPEVTVSGPETALAGSKVKIAWTGAVSDRDFVTIVPMGAEDGTYGTYIRVDDKSDGVLQMPADPGMYELRYLLDEGRRTMASQPIEVTEPEVTVSGPDEIRAGDKLRFSWTGTVSSRDYIRIVPMGSDDDYNKGDYVRVDDNTEAELNAPEQTGFYELRYTLDEGRRVLARHRFEVLAADAALNFGASLTAPDTAAPGSTIEVSWSVDAPGGDQRITLARGDQAIFTWITAIKTADGPPVMMPLPDAPGSYELRFLDVSKQEVLARKVIVVE